MKGHGRFSQGLGFSLFNVALAFILTFLLLPYGIPRVLGVHDENLTAVSTIIETQTVTVTSGNETVLSTSNGKIKLHIPKGTVEETMDFELAKHLSPGSTGMKIVNFFELNSNKHDSDNKVHEFKKEIEITIQHTPEELAGLDINSLYLYSLDEKKREWIPIPCEFDRETLTLTARVKHFSYFGEQASPLQSGPGRVMAAQVSLSSGAATYSYPIELPPGPGGFSP